MALILPNTIANETPADGDKLQQNFASLQDWANQDAITADGSTGMTAPLLLPGPPTQPNQAATKGYVDGATWIKAIKLDFNDLRVNPTGAALDFGASPITGVATVTLVCYYGFSSNAGQAAMSLSTTAYLAPDNNPWTVNGRSTGYSGAQWTNGGDSLTLMIPVTQGATPSVTATFFFDSSNLYVRSRAVITALPGTWSG